jgi:hypothetical protein
MSQNELNELNAELAMASWERDEEPSEDDSEPVGFMLVLEPAR